MTLVSLASVRTAIGLLQGFGLYLLYSAYTEKTWPASDGMLFAPLLFAAVFVPLVVLVGLGNLRSGRLAIWTGVVTALCAALAYYDIFRDPFDAGGTTSRILPTIALWLAAAAFLFIAHSLVVSAETDRRLIASYPTHFDVSWKHAVQIILAIVFTGIFWALLWLSAELFRLIKIEFLATLIRKPWFAAPATSLALAYAIHITDVRAGLVRGARTLKLTLLSWLLPMMTAIGAAFVLSLPFTGLEPLWNTRRATAILLSAVAALIVLINAAYQDGESDDSIAALLRYSRKAATIVILVLVALAAYGLFLRVEQHGWTPSRVIVFVCVVVAGCYAVGYAVAATMRLDSSLRGLETTNVFAAYGILAALLLLFSPLADPARISVADQIDRLELGRVSLREFDFNFLRFGAGRFGTAALQDLAKRTEGPQAAEIAEKANLALQARNRWQPLPVQRIDPLTRKHNVAIIHPTGQTIPESFLNHDWYKELRQFLLPRCLVANLTTCEAILSDLDGDGKDEILLFSVPSGASAAFGLATDGNWRLLGTIANAHCAGIRDALRAGQFKTIAARLKDIDVNGQRLRVTNMDQCAQPTLGGPIRVQPSR